MQFKISLRCRESNPVLPVNYQYELSAWIYRVIRNADAAYAEFLHRHGHTTGRKTFKLFCFSQLQVPNYRIEGDRLLIHSPVISFIAGFYLDRTAEEFIRGLFQDQHFQLGDRATQAAFSVETVEMRPLQWPNGPGSVRIRMLSPLVIARKRPDDAPDEYLHPGDPDFGQLLFGNLLDKYQAATGAPPPGWWDTTRFEFRPVESREPRSRLITIKSGTLAQTKVKGWMFDFDIDAPRELVEVGVLAGFGRMNSEGFGCGEIRGIDKVTARD